MATDTKLYDALGVKPSASSGEIKRAYKKLARTHHPDINGGDAKKSERFKEIAAAYAVLSDPDKRALYDEFGEIALSSGFDAERAREAQRYAREVPFAGGIDLEDLLSEIGVGRGPFDPFAAGAQGRHASRRGADMHVSLELDLERAVRGGEVTIEVPFASACDACAGTGERPSAGPRTCPDCQGLGHRESARGSVRVLTSCPRCGGQGRLAAPCPACRGAGQSFGRRPLAVRIPPGADDGDVLRIRGRGEPGVAGGPPGDLLIETRIRPHPLLRRSALDLHLKLPVDLDEAYNGASIEVPTFDGPVKLRVPPRSQPGTRLRLRGKGVRRGDRTGDLYVDLDVRLPELADEALSDALREARRAYRGPLRAGLRL